MKAFGNTQTFQNLAWTSQDSKVAKNFYDDPRNFISIHSVFIVGIFNDDSRNSSLYPAFFSKRTLVARQTMVSLTHKCLLHQTEYSVPRDSIITSISFTQLSNVLRKIFAGIMFIGMGNGTFFLEIF